MKPKDQEVEKKRKKKRFFCLPIELYLFSSTHDSISKVISNPSIETPDFI
jgi:hypothetical protein